MPRNRCCAGSSGSCERSEVSTTEPIPEDETGFDRVLGFVVPDLNARGRAVRLGPVLDTILSAHAYPPALRHLLAGHEVSTAYERGWSTLNNGELLAAAEIHGFQVLVTTDMNLKYQQNLASRSIAILVLGTTSWPRIKAAAEAVVSAVDATTRGTYVEVAIP